MTTKEFSKGEALGFGWSTMKRNLGFFIGFSVVCGLLLIVPYNIIVVPALAVNIFLGIVFLIADIVLTIIISMGWVKISLRFCGEEKGRFSDLFSQYRLFFKYVFARIFYCLIVFGGTLLLIVPGIILGIKFWFFDYFVIDKGVGPIEALKRSSAITKGVKWNLFVFFLMIVGINLLGALCLLVGLFATVPATMVAAAFVYRRLLTQTEITPVSETREEGGSMKRFRIPILVGIIVICMGIIAGSFTYLFFFRQEKGGALFINSIPEKGMVYLNGKLKGLTPLTLTSLPAEEYSLKIVKDGFRDWGEVITVFPSKRVDKVATLVKTDVLPPKISSTPITTSFTNEEIPIEAKITDDIRVERVLLSYRKVGDRDFLSLNMEGKDDRFRASIPSSFVTKQGVEYYITATDGVNTVYFPSDPSRPLRVRIKPEPVKREVKYVPRMALGSIHIVSEPSGAKAYLEGRYKGETPLRIPRLEPWKAYELRLTYEGYEDWRTKTFVEPDVVTEIKAVLKEGVEERVVGEKVVKVPEIKKEEIIPKVVKKETGMVYITSLPPRAKVYIDEKLIGETPIRGIKIEVGKSNIRLVKEGYLSSTKEVLVEKDRTTYVNFELKKGY